MSEPSDPAGDSRRALRLKLPAMYTLVRVRLRLPETRRQRERYTWAGYIYDISETGMRFELDRMLDPGTELEVEGLLPGGAGSTTFRAKGRVVRIHDEADDRFGPVRMAMAFDQFDTDEDRRHLAEYVTRESMRLRRAA